jgi:hypothetical protein
VAVRIVLLAEGSSILGMGMVVAGCGTVASVAERCRNALATFRQRGPRKRRNLQQTPSRRRTMLRERHEFYEDLTVLSQ